jgi:molecular chaperone DnaK
MASDNKSLGKFILDGIPPAPRGVPQIEVTFDINANGILEVTAVDKATNRSQHITITASSGLSESEIDRMKQEAEDSAEEDRKRKDLVDARNHADSVAYTAEKTISESGDKISDENKTELEEKTKSLRELLTSEDAEAIRSAADELGQLLQKVGAEIYQQTEGAEAGEVPQPEAGEDPDSPPDEGDVVDGEFTDA